MGQGVSPSTVTIERTNQHHHNLDHPKIAQHNGHVPVPSHGNGDIHHYHNNSHVKVSSISIWTRRLCCPWTLLCSNMKMEHIQVSSLIHLSSHLLFIHFFPLPRRQHGCLSMPWFWWSLINGGIFKIGSITSLDICIVYGTYNTVYIIC
jgi:hypothetical protein